MAKKSFLNINTSIHPAAQFVTTAAVEVAPEVALQAESAAEIQPEAVPAAEPVFAADTARPLPAAYNGEAKSKRIQLLVRPSTLNRCKAAAEANGLSLNEWIHQALENALEKR